MSEAKNILLIDDETDLLEILADILDASGYQCTVAEDVDHAIEVVKNKNIDGIISDIRMPIKSGIDLIEFLIANEMMPEVFYFMSGYSDMTKEKAKEIGANGLFEKPFDIDFVLDTLKAKLN